MDLTNFISQVIERGIAAAKRDYKPGPKLDGSIAGFEACRDKSIEELKDLLAAAHTATEDARNRHAPDYFWYRCYEAEVEWLCNCVSAALYNQGLPTIITPTARGMLAAARIVGVRE